MGAAANYMRKKEFAASASGSRPFNGLWQDLKPGDIVWCAFPFHSAPRMPGEHARPCLVLEERSIGNRTHYLVAYGTSKNLEPEQLWPGDIFFGPQDDEHFEATGLDGPGKFRLCQTALLPAVPAYFPCPPFSRTQLSNRPIDGVRLGKLTSMMTKVLHHCFHQMRAYQAKQALKGFEPAGPLGPLADIKHLATGSNQLRRKP